MRVLYVGSGGDHLADWIERGYEEVRLDINPAVEPDIVASMTDMGDIGQFDALVSQHSLEHLYPHEIMRALSEFRRCLLPGGSAVIYVPDLEDVRPTCDVLYVSAAGPITGMDLFYGHHGLIESNPFMAHHCGFTAELLRGALLLAGFSEVTTRRMDNFNLMAIGKA
jgi:SAM-dependent methyltransferase